MKTSHHADRDRDRSIDIHIQLQAWLVQAKQYPPGSRDRNLYLTKIIRVVAPKLWRFHTPYYPDALQQTWVYFAKNICTTYDPDRASMTTWLNRYLHYRHLDLLKQAIEYNQKTIPIDAQDWEGDTGSHAIKEIPSRPYGSLDLLRQMTDWVKTDPDGILRQTHMTGRPDINCQTILLLRLPPEIPWKNISTRFHKSIPALACFYQRKCLPLLRHRFFS